MLLDDFPLITHDSSLITSTHNSSLITHDLVTLL